MRERIWQCDTGEINRIARANPWHLSRLGQVVPKLFRGAPDDGRGFTVRAMHRHMVAFTRKWRSEVRKKGLFIALYRLVKLLFRFVQENAFRSHISVSIIALHSALVSYHIGWMHLCVAVVSQYLGECCFGQQHGRTHVLMRSCRRKCIGLELPSQIPYEWSDTHKHTRSSFSFAGCGGTWSVERCSRAVVVIKTQFVALPSV